jgi:hypothetical protein
MLWIHARCSLGADGGENSSAKASLKLPAQFSRAKAAFFIQATAGDNVPLHLLVDTGAGILVLSEGAANRLGEANAWHVGHTLALSPAGKTSRLELIEVANFKCGELGFDRTSGVITDLSSVSKLIGEPVDGIAGMSLFASGRIVLDYPLGELRFESGVKQNTNDAICYPLQFMMGVPLVQLECAGELINARVDSGFFGAFELPLEGSRLPFVKEPVTAGSYYNFNQIGEDKAARLGTNISLGRMTFEKPVIRSTPGTSASIGQEVLRYFVVDIDQPSKILCLTAATNGVVKSPPLRSAGFSFLPMAGSEFLEVVSVISNSEAAEAGIRKGTRIVSINNQPAKSWNVQRWRSLINESESVTVEVAQGHKTKRIRLKIITLVE